jgi:lantibiotic modifying enzyme
MEATTAIAEGNKSKSFLNAAGQVGNYLVKTAIWDAAGTCCNWLGRKDIMDREVAAYSNTNGSMTPEFYSGSGGIAFFLMELYGVTGNEPYKETALGAWLRSVRYIQLNGIPASAISFYAGDLGLLYVGYRFLQIAPQLSEILQPYLSYLTGKLETGLAVKHGIDVIGGNAGAIAPLFKLAGQTGLAKLAGLAKTCADEIISRASWKDDICFWDSPKVLGIEMDHPPLSGYSHGCSGIAVALMEAFDHTGDEQYLLHARGAFAFEHTLFNDDENNWIDTRNEHFKRNGKILGTFRSAWCHGAPGIALAHLRACAIDRENEDFHFDMAERAIMTTQKFLHEKVQEPDTDATLCHGFLGLSDILFTYGKYTNNEQGICDSAYFSEKYLALYPQIQDMPSGIMAGGYSPSLLTGLAGVGLHYLRLSAQTHVPSVLYITK